MSVINFTGDLNSKFGENLPVPFIEKVNILNNEEMSVQLSLYFNIDLFTSKNFQQYLEETGVGDLQIYASLIMERSENKIYSDIVSGNKSVIAGITSSFPIITDIGTKKLILESQSDTFETQSGTNLFNFGTILEAYEGADIDEGVNFGEYYDENNNPVFRLVVNETIKISINNQLIVEDQDGVVTPTSEFGNSLVSFSQSEDQGITTFGICCFTAVKNFVPFLGESAPQGLINSKSSQISDVAYLTITKDFIVATEPEDVFVDENDELVDFVMQSIDGNFYQQQQDVSNSIREQMLSLTKGRSTTAQLQSIYDSIDKTIALNPNPTFLLPQLNEIRQAFIDKSTATEVGRFYFIFDDKLTKSNVLVKSGKKVRKLSIANPRLLDQRSVGGGLDLTQGASNGDPDGVKSEQYKDGTRAINSTFGPSSGTSREWSGGSAFIYPGATRFGREIFLNDKSFSDKTIILRDLGFFFFDYEKALRSCSDLSMLVNVEKVENFFGRSMTNNTYLLDHAKVYFSEYLPESQSTLNPLLGDDGDIPAAGQTHAEDSYQLLYTIETDFANNSAIGNKTTSSTSGQRNVGVLGSGELTKDSVDIEGNSETNYVALRSFDTAIDGNLNLVNDNFYRLMCFEFQRVNSLDAIDVDVSNTMSDIVDREYDFYEFEVAVVDKTYKVYRNLIDNLVEAMEEFSGYYDSSLENCSYDSERASFNDFFIDSKNQEYEDNPELAPWNRIALIYHFHLDLLTNVHGGDLIQIQSAAASTSETLSPSTGNPEQIQAFNNLLNDLYNRFYNPNTPDNDLKIGSPEYKLRQARDAAMSSSPTITGISWHNNIFDSSGNENPVFSSQVVFGPDPTRQDPSTSAYTFGPTEINNLGYKDGGDVVDWTEDLQESFNVLKLQADKLAWYPSAYDRLDQLTCIVNNNEESNQPYWGDLFKDPSIENIDVVQEDKAIFATNSSTSWFYDWFHNLQSPTYDYDSDDFIRMYGSFLDSIVNGDTAEGISALTFSDGSSIPDTTGDQTSTVDQTFYSSTWFFSNYKLGTTYNQYWKHDLVNFTFRDTGVGWNELREEQSWTLFINHFANKVVTIHGESLGGGATTIAELKEYIDLYVDFLRNDGTLDDFCSNLWDQTVLFGKTFDEFGDPSAATLIDLPGLQDRAQTFFENIATRLRSKTVIDLKTEIQRRLALNDGEE